MTTTPDIGPFELAERIGRGGMGGVWRATHRETDVEVAIKVIRPKRVEDRRDAFEREVRAHAELLHPGIVYLFEYGELREPVSVDSGEELPAGSPFVAMELAKGGSVRELAPFESWNPVRQGLVQVLDALAHAHARGVIHRDLKPQNVLLFGDDPVRVKLADFGVAHAYGEEDVRDTGELTAAAGTPVYMSPEQGRGDWREYGPWTDLYALGCIVWELVCGRPPIQRANPIKTLIAHERAERPELDPQFPVPEGLEAWIHRAMAIRPGDRFQRAADAGRALERLGGVDREPAEGGQEGTDDGSPLPETVEVPTRDDQMRPTLELPSIPERGEDAPADEPRAGADGGAAPAEMDVGSFDGWVPDSWRKPEPADLPSQLVGTGLGLFGLRETPFVDREEACDRIWRALREVEERGEPGGVVIVGSAGSGKSRLAEWIATRAHELGAVEVLRAFHAPGSGGVFEGVSGMIRRAVRGYKLDRGELYEYLLEHLPELDDSGVDRETDARALTELVFPTGGGAEVAGPRYKFSSRDQQLAVVARFVRRYASRRPALVWLDDLQWSELGLGFLERLRERQTGRQRTLVVATVRSEALAESPEFAERVEALTGGAQFPRIQLEPLAEQDHRRFIERLLPLEPEFADRIADRTAGNPLFAEQLIAECVERRWLAPGPDGFTLDESAPSRLPGDVHELLMLRLDRVVSDCDAGPPERLWLAIERAAVLGREVAQREWRALCDDLGLQEREALLDLLLERGLVERRDRGWIFTHRWVVESLERRAREGGRWREHHRRCADLLERLADAPWHSSTRRAEHRVAGGQPDRALEPLLEESDRLTYMRNFEAAREILRRREALLDDLGVPAEDSRRIENDIRTYECALELGSSQEEVLELAEEARDRAERIGDEQLKAMAMHVAARCLQGLREFERAETQFQTALECAESAGDPRVQVWALFRCGRLLVKRGEAERGEEYFEEALERARRFDLVFGRMRVRTAFGWSALLGGDFGRAQAEFEELVEQYERAGARREVAECLNGLGELHRFQGELDRARTYYNRYLDVAREIGAPSDVAMAKFNLATVDLVEGQFDRADRLLDESEEIFESVALRGVHLQMVQSARLVRAAGREDWREYAALAEELDASRAEASNLGEEIPRLLEMAGDYAAKAGAPGRASWAWRYARDIRDERGEAEAVEVLEEKIARASS